MSQTPKIDVVDLLRTLERQGEDYIRRTAQEAREEIERLRDSLRTAQYRGMVDERISYKSYSYGMRSMDGIRDLQRAINRDKNY